MLYFTNEHIETKIKNTVSITITSWKIKKLTKHVQNVYADNDMTIHERHHWKQINGETKHLYDWKTQYGKDVNSPKMYVWV